MTAEKARDLRVEKTRRAIHRAFEELLMEKDYDRITVKELCEHAMINRKTFYSHYAYLDDLMEEYISEIAENYIRDVGPSEGFEDLPNRVRRFFLYLPKVPPLAEKLVMSRRGLHFFQRVGDSVSRQAPEESEGIEQVSESTRSIIMDYLNNACFTIFQSWVLDGKKLTTEELSELAYTLICGGMDDLLGYINR